MQDLTHTGIVCKRQLWQEQWPAKPAQSHCGVKMTTSIPKSTEIRNSATHCHIFKDFIILEKKPEFSRDPAFLPRSLIPPVPFLPALNNSLVLLPAPSVLFQLPSSHPLSHPRFQLQITLLLFDTVCVGDPSIQCLGHLIQYQLETGLEEKLEANNPVGSCR